MLMKIPKDVLDDKGITYNQKYPYGELSNRSQQRVPTLEQ